ncbi:MAG: DUF881 domain-containing protein [Frankiaceae bacterium]|jgi:uncharacterized protein YlxW (UPF0749 family)
MNTRLRRLMRPRASRAQLLIALLCALLGFALAVQVRTAGSDGARRNARPEDLARILDDLGARSDRLRSEVDQLRVTRDRLANGTDRSRAALMETQHRAEELGILAGTLPASGPGVLLTISDPQGKVRANVVLDAVEELRDAGAEAMQLAGSRGAAVRIVAATAFQDDPAGGLRIGSGRIAPPYRLTVIGEPATLAPALRIPGGVVDTVAALPGARADIVSAARVTVAALQPVATPRYARPAATPTPG